MFNRQARFTCWNEAATSRVVAAVLLLAMILAIVGLPQPIRKSLRPGERFPCESCACGCSTAAYCWDHCCCHSDVEKLAWADTNGVKAPEFLVTRVAAAKQTENRLVATPSCCRKPAVASCCATGKATSKAAATSMEGQGVADSAPQADTVESVRYLSFQAYAKCRGMNLVWTLLREINVKTPKACEVKPEAPLVAWYRIDDEFALNLSLAPEPPVPWQAM